MDKSCRHNKLQRERKHEALDLILVTWAHVFITLHFCLVIFGVLIFLLLLWPLNDAIFSPRSLYRAFLSRLQENLCRIPHLIS